jgi:hypothetical protein
VGRPSPPDLGRARGRSITARLVGCTLLASVVVAASLSVPATTSGGVARILGQTVTAAPAVPGAPSLGTGSVRVLVDNDYALFLGDGTNVNEVRYQNDEEWSRQLDEATSVDVRDGDVVCYVGGQASFENGDPTDTCYSTPSDQAEVVRFPASAVRFPTAGNGRATIYWSAPTTGATPTSYIVKAHLASDDSLTDQTCSPIDLTDLQCTETGLTNGPDYKFTVIALNDAGPSDLSPVTATLRPTGPTVPVVIASLMDLAPPSVMPGVRPLPMGGIEVVSCAPGTTTGCIVQSVTVEVLQQEFVIRSDEFTMRLSGECATTCGITSLEDGRQMLEFESGGSVRVQGEGFLPGARSCA